MLGKADQAGGAFMETKTKSPWLDYEGAEEYTGYEKTTLWRAVRRGELRVGGVNRAPRFHRDDLDQWMRTGGVGRE